MTQKVKASKGPYLNYFINHGDGVVIVKMFDRNDKQGIVQDDIDDDPHRGGRLFKILGNRGFVIEIWSLTKTNLHKTNSFCQTVILFLESLASLARWFNVRFINFTCVVLHLKNEQ